MNGEKAISWPRDTGVIISADVTSLEALVAIIALAGTSAKVVAIKVGFTLVLRFGLRRVVKEIKTRSSLPVIYDHQKGGTDIPEMGLPFASACGDSGVDGVIFFPQSGPRTLEAFVRTAIQEGLLPIVGLVMTHSGYLVSEGGYIADSAADDIYRIATNLGVSTFVLPGTKPELVRTFAAKLAQDVPDATIMMPGIGSQGGDVSTSFEAARPVRHFAIIGSSIYAATDPRQALTKLLQDVQ